ncbi:Rad50/SbcC-type AAA domain-containing protein [Vibrio crassostreae]|nr:Rad50/SbcC-type AAA domain-containing protein [Vibrio crassostreae]CAK1785187.1 Rad50/SbcC-type AAA domain-containing protein [Vibrio crassostreae]CAK1835574.1 Rad50/SbcC-type AAA domain-containing protein [Vibrio crassostreae]CAK2274735.1 Rad50/SbcC-type AAA domain-containing protein [Vibrio crassostreae]CAK2649133.1 Rad50/SbcC-type AAA domain-containing protein [Vibrio crassostreae]
MKIKKVEIQAFRAYDQLDNGTFDFSTASGDIADFISIYAPNGFGKTSFYDAVEWGVTNNISRFLRRKNENKLSAKAESQKYIYRNKFSSEELDSFVKIHTNSNDTLIENNFDHRALRSNQRDNKFDLDATIEDTKYFLDVILSQDWIDAFLKEDDSCLRYDKFMNSFGDKELDKKYKVIIGLIKINKNKIDTLDKQLAILKKSLQSDFDQELLVKINSAIKTVNQKGPSLPLISPSFTESDDVKFNDLLTERIKDLEFNLEQFKEKEALIENTLTNKSDINIMSYHDKRMKISDLDKEISILNVYNKGFKKINIINDEISKIRLLLDERLNLKSELLELLKVYPNYKQIKSDIDNEEAAILELKKQINEEKSLSSEQSKVLSENLARKSILVNTKKDLDSKLECAEDFFRELERNKREVKRTNDFIKTQDLILEEHRLLIDDMNSKVKFYDSFIDRINRDDYPIIVDQDLEEFVPIVESIKNDKLKVSEFDKDVEKINLKLEETSSLNKELKKIIELGSAIIVKNKLIDCPLCRTNFDSFEALSKRINNNPSLDNSFNDLIKKRTEIETNILKLKEKSGFDKSKLVKGLSSLIDDKNEVVNNKRIKLSKLELNREEKFQILKKLELKINEAHQETNDLNLIEYKDLLSNKLEACVKSQLSINDKLQSSKILIKKYDNSISILSAKLNVSTDRVSSLYKYLDFQSINNYKNKTLTGNSFSEENLNEPLAKLNDLIDKDKNEISSLEKQAEELSRDIPSVNVDKISKDIEEKVSNKKQLQGDNLSVEKFFSINFDREITKLESSSLVNILEEERAIIKDNVYNVKIHINDYRKISEYKSNVIPFLKHQKNLSEYSSVLAERKFLDETLAPELDKEKKKVSRFIHEQVKSFFYQDLINSLYSKIDPHPKYKTISFKCDFTQDKPRLHVFVNDSSGGIVPTLYFSSAQLNILSLSIFLAKALNVKNPKTDESVDCIFIDDPIQAMDSINILSVIDLFRSIVVNMGKQIILSTHDENFYNLLQKKMPNELFKTRYIELESFGKVKKHS